MLFSTEYLSTQLLGLLESQPYASNNLRRLQRINSQETRVSLRVEEDRAPEHLQLAADEAARSGVLRTSIEYAGGARHTIQFWLLLGPELRTWDPGD